MKTLLVRHTRLMVTMDAERREIEDGAVFICGGAVKADHQAPDPPLEAYRLHTLKDSLTPHRV